jgi:hypothetical protein
VEIWGETRKFGEFADGVFTLGERFSVPHECDSDGACVRAWTGEPVPPTTTQAADAGDSGKSVSVFTETAAELQDTVAPISSQRPADSAPPTVASKEPSLQLASRDSSSDFDQDNRGPKSRDRHKGFYGTLGTGGTDAGSIGGLALTAGLGLRAGPFLMALNVMDVTLSRGDTGPYYVDEFSNGQSRCRNGDNGQFASDSKCVAIDTDYAASADLNLLVPGTPLFLGGGGRIGGDDDLWYGSIGAAWGSSSRRLWVLRGNVGKDYVSGLISVGFHL